MAKHVHISLDVLCVSTQLILCSLGTLSCPWSCTGGPITFEILSITYCLILLHDPSGWGLGAFLRWWPPSAMWAGPLIYHGNHRGCLNNSIFLNLELCAACWAHFMCHHELWPTSVSHPFSFLNSSHGLAGRKHYKKITIPILRLVLQNFVIPGYFPYILFYHYLFSLLPLWARGPQRLGWGAELTHTATGEW